MAFHFRQTDNTANQAARYFTKMPDGRLRCDLCPRFCQLNDGQRGLCFVRARKGDQMELTTYGRSTGFCIDPIEKKPLNHFYPGQPILSFGTAGCNLTCHFCQNHDISKAKSMDRLMERAQPEDIAEMAQKQGCFAVAYTYNDPVIFLEYAVDVAAACREVGLKNVAVTAGYITETARPEFFQAMDAVNLDLKAFTPKFYKKLCAADIEPVLETARYIYHETQAWLELTVLLIPYENDGVDEIAAMSDWILSALGPDIPVHFTAFHPDYRMLDKPRTPPETLMRARQIAKDAGLFHVYTGNIHHEETQSSYCSNCGSRVIGRDWHLLSHWGLDEKGNCLNCGTEFPGHFDGRPGNWGRKRLPLRMPHRA